MNGFPGIQESDFAERNIDLRFHGNGFIQVHLNSVSRLHIWSPNFAKLTDSRSKNYIRKYGDKSWELDALDPKVITKLIKKTVDEFRDIDLWNEKQEQLDGETDRLDEIIEELE